MTDLPNDPIDKSPDALESAAADPPVEQVDEATPDAVADDAVADEVAPLEADTEVGEQEVDEVQAADEQPAEDDPVAAEEEEATESTEEDAEQDSEAEADSEEAEADSEDAEEEEKEKKDWYILKVQSNREDSIRDGLIRRVAIAGLEPFFGDIIVPTEKVTEFKGGKKKIMTRKLYPGYLVVHMEITDDTWFLVRETPGIGDFTGAAGAPTPMLPHEVSRILARQEEKTDEAPKLKIAFRPGDQVKINDGTFESFEGEVETIDESNGRVTVMINIFGRSTPVELEYWQIESV